MVSDESYRLGNAIPVDTVNFTVSIVEETGLETRRRSKKYVFVYEFQRHVTLTTNYAVNKEHAQLEG